MKQESNENTEFTSSNRAKWASSKWKLFYINAWTKPLKQVRDFARRLTKVGVAMPHDFTNRINVLKTAVTQLRTVLNRQQPQPMERKQKQMSQSQHDERRSDEACSRCDGRCTSLKSCWAMGKI